MSQEAVERFLENLINASDTQPIQNVFFHQFSLPADLITKFIRKFNKSLQEFTLKWINGSDGRGWKAVFRELLTCKLRFVMIHQESRVGFRGEHKYEINRPRYSHEMVDEECPFIGFGVCDQQTILPPYKNWVPGGEEYEMIGEHNCRGGLQWLVDSNTVLKFGQYEWGDPSLFNEVDRKWDWAEEREMFEDMDLEMAYRRRYRREMKAGQRLPNERYSYDWWYQKKYDAMVKGGFRWEYKDRIAEDHAFAAERSLWEYQSRLDLWGHDSYDFGDSESQDEGNEEGGED